MAHLDAFVLSPYRLFFTAPVVPTCGPDHQTRTPRQHLGKRWRSRRDEVSLQCAHQATWHRVPSIVQTRFSKICRPGPRGWRGVQTLFCIVKTTSIPSNFHIVLGLYCGERDAWHTMRLALNIKHLTLNIQTCNSMIRFRTDSLVSSTWIDVLPSLLMLGSLYDSYRTERNFGLHRVILVNRQIRNLSFMTTNFLVDGIFRHIHVQTITEGIQPTNISSERSPTNLPYGKVHQISRIISKSPKFSPFLPFSSGFKKSSREDAPPRMAHVPLPMTTGHQHIKKLLPSHLLLVVCIFLEPKLRWMHRPTKMPFKKKSLPSRVSMGGRSISYWSLRMVLIMELF